MTLGVLIYASHNQLLRAYQSIQQKQQRLFRENLPFAMHGLAVVLNEAVLQYLGARDFFVAGSVTCQYRVNATSSWVAGSLYCLHVEDDGCNIQSAIASESTGAICLGPWRH